MYIDYISFWECKTYKDRCLEDLVDTGCTDCSVEIYEDDERGSYEQEVWSLNAYTSLHVYIDTHEDKLYIKEIAGHVPFYKYGQKDMTKEQKENCLNLLRDSAQNPTLTFDTMDELVNSVEVLIEEMYESKVSYDFFARVNTAQDDLDDVGYDGRRL